MPPQDPLRKGHAAARDDAAVHGQPPMPVVMDRRGKERSEGSTRMLQQVPEWRQPRRSCPRSTSPRTAGATRAERAATSTVGRACRRLRGRNLAPASPATEPPSSSAEGPGIRLLLLPAATPREAAASTTSVLTRHPRRAPRHGFFGNHMMPRRRRASTTQPSPPQREPGDPELCLVSEIGLEIWRGWCLCFPQNPRSKKVSA